MLFRSYINVSPSVPNGDYVYVSGTPSALFAHSPGIVYTSFDYAPDGFTVSSPGELKHFSTDGSLKKSVSSYGWGSPAISQGIIYNQDIWIADINYGLVKGDNQLRFELMNLQGPASNFVERITSLNGKTIICAGGIDKYGKGLKREYSVSVHENNKYTNLISEGLFDAILSCIDPDDPDHYFISTAGYGLLEYDKNVLVNHFGGNNLQPVSSAQGSGEMIISGMAFDKAGNLWITQTGSPGSIRVLTTEGKWITFPFTIESSVAGEIIVTRDGIKWIVLPGENGLFVLDDNKTPGAFGDDKSKKFMVRDPDGKIITRVTSLAEDFDGNIWVGTGQGPLIYYEPKKIIEDDPAAFRIKVPRNDGTGLADYLLSTETITAVVVDGANRKWLGTEGSGAYLLSADGTVKLKNYNKQNSPVFSDSIRSIAVDNKTGEVWLGTSAGVLSVREIATGGSQDYMKVYAFPNPVREDFTGNVTITGLIKDTQVWITDISGNLVNKTRSEGGQASWDLSTYSGRRVSTGVYLIFCATDDGSRSFVTKILVIR